MNMTVKKILFPIVLVAVVAMGIGVYEFNKGPVDVRNAEGININATELYDVFSKDSAAALKKYAGKIISVMGDVSSTASNQKKQQVILLNQTKYLHGNFQRSTRFYPSAHERSAQRRSTTIDGHDRVERRADDLGGAGGDLRAGRVDRDRPAAQAG